MQLPGLLRAKQETGKKMTCHREENFFEMYAALGDRIKQDRIRQLNPDRKHCPFLKASPSACNCLPTYEGIPKETIGEMCPSNPYVRFKSFYDQIIDYADLIEDVSLIESQVKLNVVPTTENISPLEFMVAVVVHDFYKIQDMNLDQMKTLMGSTHTLGSALGSKK